MIGATGVPWADTPAALTESLKLALSSDNRFLDITVMSDANGPEKPANEWQTLAPRQSLNAVPYAMNGVPTGTVVPFAGTTAPDGWTFCDGTTTFPINDARYRSLHNTIGTMFNNGTEPEGHFRLPDLRAAPQSDEARETRGSWPDRIFPPIGCSGRGSGQRSTN